MRIWFTDGTVPGLRAQIDATIRSGTGSFVYGIGAWNGATAEYMLVSSSEGGAAIVKEAGARTGAKTRLVTGDQPAVTKTVHFVFEVRGGGTNGPTKLVGTVNGVPVQASDRNGFDSFSGIGISIYPSQGPVDVLWDNLTVNRLG
jgi:hypothetical protein